VLIWVGGTLTTYGAGMIVDVSPTTIRYWLVPPTLWTGSWALLLEHGHRLLAQLMGVIAVALTVTMWRTDRRKWMRWLALAAVGGVCVECLLGGLRVVFDELLLAKLHGCTAPLLFCLCAAMVTFTSVAWQRSKRLSESLLPSPRLRGEGSGVRGPQAHPSARGMHRLTLLVTLAIYLQIVLGVQLRHLPPQNWLGWFEIWVWSKLIVAGLITVGFVWLLIYALGRLPDQRALVGRAKLLAALLIVQLLLGAGNWVTNYGWPGWFADYVWAVNYTAVQHGRLQVVITTTHVAAGSLNLAVAISLTLWSFRRLRGLPG